MSDAGGWRNDLDRRLQPFLAGLSHPARRATCSLYVAGLIGLGDCKSVWPMAARGDGCFTIGYTTSLHRGRDLG